MAREHGKPKRRLNLDTSEEVRKRLEDLRDETDADSITQVIARATAVYEFLIKEQSKGGKIVIKPKKGNEREVVLIPTS